MKQIYSETSRHTVQLCSYSQTVKFPKKLHKLMKSTKACKHIEIETKVQRNFARVLFLSEKKVFFFPNSFSCNKHKLYTVSAISFSVSSPSPYLVNNKNKLKNYQQICTFYAHICSISMFLFFSSMFLCFLRADISLSVSNLCVCSCKIRQK